MKFTDTLLDLLFPPKCPFCRKVQDAPGMCPACEKSLPRADEACGLRTLRGGLLCTAPLWYENSVREAIRRFKFHGGVSAAKPLGEFIAQAAAERFSGGFDTVTWVPVSAKRLRQRGYDQSRLLAENACGLWGVEPEPLLRKVRDNPAQSSLDSAEDRWRNTRGVYAAAGEPAGKRVHPRLCCGDPPGGGRGGCGLRRRGLSQAGGGKQGRKSERIGLHSGKSASIIYSVTLWIRWRFSAYHKFNKR